MSETTNLTALRTKLIARRRQIVETQANNAVEQMAPDSIVRIQEAIEAVDRALADESAAAFRSRPI